MAQIIVGETIFTLSKHRKTPPKPSKASLCWN